MASVTLKNLPPELHRRLKEQAVQHGRSLHGEILWCLRAASEAAQQRDEALKRARRFRASMKFTLSENEVNRLKRHRRP